MKNANKLRGRSVLKKTERAEKCVIIFGGVWKRKGIWLCFRGTMWALTLISLINRMTLVH